MLQQTGILTKISSLLMLVVFSANLSAVCRCNHILKPMAGNEHTPSCCHRINTNKEDRADKKNCGEKSCPCEKRIVAFNQLEKQVSQKVAILQMGTALIDFSRDFQFTTTTYSCHNNNTPNQYKGKYRVFPPPDYCVLYNAFRI